MTIKAEQDRSVNKTLVQVEALEVYEPAVAEEEAQPEPEAAPAAKGKMEAAPLFVPFGGALSPAVVCAAPGVI